MLLLVLLCQFCRWCTKISCTCGMLVCTLCQELCCMIVYQSFFTSWRQNLTKIKCGYVYMQYREVFVISFWCDVYDCFVDTHEVPIRISIVQASAVTWLSYCASSLSYRIRWVSPLETKITVDYSLSVVYTRVFAQSRQLFLLYTS